MTWNFRSAAPSWPGSAAAAALVAAGVYAAAWTGPSAASAQQAAPPEAKQEETKKEETPKSAEAPAPAPKAGVDEAGLIRLSPEADVWLDKKNKRLVLKGEVCLQRGPLEMLVTLAGTKTHEAVVACKVKAFIVHAGLLALGAKPGATARFSPEFRPPSGTEIEVRFRWTDAAGKEHDLPGQDWVRHARTKQAMTTPFVFAGSGFLVNENTGERTYLAEEGDFVCVSNFPTAMLDVPIKSTQTDADLNFEAFYERIPPVRTPVTVLLVPKFAAAPAPAPAPKAPGE